jgi:hypothetical protein
MKKRQQNEKRTDYSGKRWMAFLSLNSSNRNSVLGQI